MAKQISFMKYTGRLGDTVGYKYNGEYLVRTRPKFSDEARANSPRYSQTRKLNTEFANTVKDSKFFRMAFIDILDKIGCKNLHGKLNGKFLQLLKRDHINEVGSRRAHYSDFFELHHLELAEEGSSFSNTFIGKIEYHFNEDNGSYKISFTDVHFSKSMATSKNTNSCRLMASVAKIDFKEEKYSVDVAYSEYLALNNKTVFRVINENDQANIDLELSLDPTVQGKLFLILGIEYSSLINGYRQLTYGNSGMLITRY